MFGVSADAVVAVLSHHSGQAKWGDDNPKLMMPMRGTAGKEEGVRLT